MGAQMVPSRLDGPAQMASVAVTYSDASLAAIPLL